MYTMLFIQYTLYTDYHQYLELFNLKIAFNPRIHLKRALRGQGGGGVPDRK